MYVHEFQRFHFNKSNDSNLDNGIKDRCIMLFDFFPFHHSHLK